MCIHLKKNTCTNPASSDPSSLLLHSLLRIKCILQASYIACGNHPKNSLFSEVRGLIENKPPNTYVSLKGKNKEEGSRINLYCVYWPGK